MSNKTELTLKNYREWILGLLIEELDVKFFKTENDAIKINQLSKISKDIISFGEKYSLFATQQLAKKDEEIKQIKDAATNNYLKVKDLQSQLTARDARIEQLELAITNWCKSYGITKSSPSWGEQYPCHVCKSTNIMHTLTVSFCPDCGYDSEDNE